MSVSSQRWRARRTLFRQNKEIIDPKIHSVDVISCMKEAKPFVLEHHYSGSFPATRLSCGLFRNSDEGSKLVGIASFSVSMNPSAGGKYTGLSGNSSVELGRLVLLDEVESNGESWFVSKAFSLLRCEKPEIEAVYAYSDPVPRFDQTGNLLMPGHIGEVYQALSAECRGRSVPRTQFKTPDGMVFNERTLSKIRLNESGAEYATSQLLETGVSSVRSHENPREWIERLINTGEIQKDKHPGNWVYTFGLTKKAKALSRKIPTHERPRKTGYSSKDVSQNQKELIFV